MSEGDCFTRSELGNDIGLMGALLLFVLRVVAGACVGRGSGCERILPTVVPDIRRGDSRDGKRGRGG